MLYLLTVVLLVAWVLGYGVFQVAGGVIHLLLVLALLSVVVNLIRGEPRAR